MLCALPSLAGWALLGIHLFDQRFRGATELAFHEAYYTHTSTSPNYQILAAAALLKGPIGPEKHPSGTLVLIKALGRSLEIKDICALSHACVFPVQGPPFQFFGSFCP